MGSKKEIIPEEFIDGYRYDGPCTACGIEGEGFVCYHHVHSRGAHNNKKYDKENLIPVCLLHHNEFHSKGNLHMAFKYSRVHEWLISNNWYICKSRKKWVHDAN